MTKRPTLYDEPIRQAVAAQLVAVVRKRLPNIADSYATSEGGEENLRDDLEQAIDSAFSYDGFKLAMVLNDSIGWDCDEDIVEVLSCASGLADDAVRTAEIAWAASAQIGPPLSVGQVVAFTHRGVYHSYGEVYRAEPERLRYCVYCAALGHVREGTGVRGLLLNHEDLTPVTGEPKEAP